MVWKINWFGFFFFVLAGCKVNYSFTGASVDPSIKTVSITQFENKAPLASPTLSPLITEKLRDKFVSQTSIRVINSEDAADIGYKGSIVGYEVAPAGFSGNDQSAALNRLSITIEVTYFDKKDLKNSWQQRFVRYADFSGSVPLGSVEATLVNDISKQLAEDLFNKSFVNW